MNSIAFAVIVLVVLGLAGGIILVLASKFMAVYEDPRIAQITECLAGANCGGCGYAGCADYAKAIVENGAPTNKCAPGGAKATEAVNAIMGTESASGPALHAVVNCNGGNGNCGTRFEYHGIPTCAAAAAIAGGPSACAYGCLGLGDCTRACKFDAIHLNRTHPEFAHYINGDYAKQAVLKHGIKRAAKLTVKRLTGAK